MTESAEGESQDAPRAVALRIAEESVARLTSAGALWSAGATIVVAVSGGADSLCLLGTLLALRDSGAASAPGEMIVATLDHGLRGEAGDADARWVAALATSLGLRCVSGQVDAQERARASHLSLEDAARRLRYTFLRQVAQEVGAARICLGHTLDDQAETIILRLLRGSGLDGLAGMRPVRGDLARPLLDLTHAQAVAYCAARGWLPREDATNRDEHYLRNRVRRRLLPLLEAYNPNVRRTLARNATFIADDYAWLEDATDHAWAELVTEATADHITLRLSALREQSPALRRRLLRRATTALIHGERDDEQTGGLEARHITLVEAFIAHGRTGGALMLPDGLRASLGYDAFSLRRVAVHTGEAPNESQPAELARGEWSLPIPGVVEIPELGWRVRALPLSTPPGLEGDALPPMPYVSPTPHAGTAGAIHRGELRVYLDADCLHGPLTVRTWRPGDRFRPLGMTHDKKLQDVFSDAKASREIRHRLPIVCSGERIVWVAGVRIADDCKLTLETRQALALQAEPID